MKVLILGGNGLVGSSLNKILSESKKVQKVFAATRRDADLFSLSDTKSLINTFRPDVVVNSAAKVGGINANNTQRMEFIIENLKINMNVFQACIDNPKVKIINLGSSCIYPLNAENPIKESSFMDGKLEETNSPYALAKITSIELGKSLNKQYGHEVINLMPTNLYGPRDNFSDLNSHVIPGLIQRIHKAKKNKTDITIWGSGKPLREFMYVDDLADAIHFVIQNDVKKELLNVGSGIEISINDLAILISEIVEYKGNIQFDFTKPDGNPRKLMDSNLINNLGWNAKTDLETGLKKTYAWYTENVS